jgi:ribosomal protein L3 glutamine methyltransferase
MTAPEPDLIPDIPPLPAADAVAAELVTVRDLLRHAVTRFAAAGIVFGHGTTTALDEAAFIVLEALHLPVDRLDPWLDCRLLPDERRRIAGLIEARITTRMPAAYLIGRTYLVGVPFRIDARAIIPRSYLAELLPGDLFGGDGDGLVLVDDPSAVTRVLDLCTGSGCLAVLAAQRFPEAMIDATDLSADALALARENIADHGLEGRIRLHQGDLFAPVEGYFYDLILANPPYVSETVVAAFPPEYAAEPRMAHAGGADGLDIVRRILADAGRHLADDGWLICEIGEDREILEAEYPELPFLWLDTAESEGEVFALSAGDLAGRDRA